MAKRKALRKKKPTKRTKKRQAKKKPASVEKIDELRKGKSRLKSLISALDKVEKGPVATNGRINPEAVDLQRIKALAETAIRKLDAGEEPTQTELNGARKYELRLQELYGIPFVEAVPHRLYRQWAGGREYVVLKTQADAYGFPIRGDFISIPSVIKHLHSFLTANQYKLLPKNSPNDDQHSDRYREAKADMAEDERDTRRGQLIPRFDARRIHTMWEHLLRGAGEKLGRKFGSDAQSILNEALDGCVNLIDDFYGPDVGG